ncbi:hypothetical protein BJ165DRAFT_1529860 [Panaeolus papilionaceus]|nr:hypothetical protein BJ165DRAFT_1529860 [Panaeolus papilionaceus]
MSSTLWSGTMHVEYMRISAIPRQPVSLLNMDLLSILGSSSPSSPQVAAVSLFASMFFCPACHPRNRQHLVGQVCPSGCSVRHYDREILEEIPQATCIKGQAASGLFLSGSLFPCVIVLLRGHPSILRTPVISLRNPFILTP